MPISFSRHFLRLERLTLSLSFATAENDYGVLRRRYPLRDFSSADILQTSGHVSGLSHPLFTKGEKKERRLN